MNYMYRSGLWRAVVPGASPVPPEPPPPGDLVGDYYVSPSGSDGAAGTSRAAPFQTLSKGFSMLGPGKTLVVMTGTYLHTSQVTMSSSNAGSDLSHARVVCEAGAIISGDANGDGQVGPDDYPAAAYTGLVRFNAAYTDVIGLTVAFSGERGIQLTGSHITLQDCVVHHTWGPAVCMFGSYNTLDGCTIYRAADSNYCGGVSGDRACNGNWPGGIQIGDPNSGTPASGSYSQGYHSTVKNSIIYQVSGEGILLMHVDGCAIDNNTVYDCWAQDIDLDHVRSTSITNNHIYYNPENGWWKSSRPGSGIMIANETTLATYPHCEDILVENNNIQGAGSNFFYWTDADHTGIPMNHFTVRGNHFTEAQGSGETGIKIAASSGPHTSTVFENNVISQHSGTIASGDASGITFRGNTWSPSTPSGWGNNA